MYTANPSRYDRIEYRRCGASGLLLPPVSLGLWHNFGALHTLDAMQQLLTHAFDLGITHFDLANNYGPPIGRAEENLGLLIKKVFKPYRDELIISTKAGYEMQPGPYGNWGSRKYLLSSLDQSLTRLGLDYADIFYHHRMDPATPLEETMGALDSAVRSGKALYAGLSNYDGPTLKQAAAILKELKTPFVICQNRYSLLDKTIEHNGLLEAAGELKKGIIAFSPLAQGQLSDKYLHGIPADSRLKVDPRFLHEDVMLKNLSRVRRLNEIALGRGQTLAQMALSWLLRRSEVVSVLVGVSKLEQLDDNLQAAARTDFTKEELAAIEEAIKAPAA